MPTMKDLAALLGVELGEEFEVEKVEDGQRLGVYMITNEEIKVSASGGNWWSAQLCGVVEKICTGRYRIIKKPWKPRPGQHYYFISKFEDEEAMVSMYCFGKCMRDYANYAIGNCFRTLEEAEAHKDEIVAKLEEIYEKGRENEG